MLSIMVLGCQKMNEVKTEEKGIEILMKDINVKENTKTGFTLIQLNTLITNRSDNEISAVTYELQLLDGNGELIKSYKKTYFGEDKSISRDQSVSDYYGFQDRLEKQPEAYALKVVEVKDTEELPLIHLPLPDEYLYQAIGLERLDSELPNRILVYIDHMGAREEINIEGEENLTIITDLFCKIKIAKETDAWVTDNYNGIIFYFADGTSKSISLNLYNLEIRNHNIEHIYELADLGPFMQACSYYKELMTADR
ncbi:MAG: hypothetical protein IJF87_07115 [Erysipelotrichaceae bacterium]|nr:hypothetical protein [Erysipelotrichaceae bacterium]